MGALERGGPGVHAHARGRRRQHRPELGRGHHGQGGLRLAGPALVEADGGGLHGQGGVAHDPAQEGLLGRDELHLRQRDLHPAAGGEALLGDEAVALAQQPEAPVLEQRAASGEGPARGEGQQEEGQHGQRAEAPGELPEALRVQRGAELHGDHGEEGDRAHAPLREPEAEQLQRAVLQDDRRVFSLGLRDAPAPLLQRRAQPLGLLQRERAQQPLRAAVSGRLHPQLHEPAHLVKQVLDQPDVLDARGVDAARAAVQEPAADLQAPVVHAVAQREVVRDGAQQAQAHEEEEEQRIRALGPAARALPGQQHEQQHRPVALEHPPGLGDQVHGQAERVQAPPGRLGGGLRPHRRLPAGRAGRAGSPRAPR